MYKIMFPTVFSENSTEEGPTLSRYLRSSVLGALTVTIFQRQQAKQWIQGMSQFDNLRESFRSPSLPTYGLVAVNYPACTMIQFFW